MGKHADEPKKPYTPMGVLNMLKAKGVAVPVGKDFGKKPMKIADAQGTPLYEAPKIPDTCCLLLLAFTNGSTLIPDDFHNIEKSGKGLKRYIRPDGGVYLGTFGVEGEPDGLIVVYGDPAMSQQEAQRFAMQYRGELIERWTNEKMRSELGSFAAGAVPETPPAVS